MEKILQNIFRLLTIGFICINLSSVANAASVDAILSGIEISPINGSYEITINTNKAVPIKTRSLSNSKMHIDLKGITPSKSINTVYKNATNIDHVLVRPMGKDVRIILKGDNVASSQVLLNTSKIPLNFLSSANKKKTLVLNKSINSYKPLTTEDVAEEESIPQGIILPLNIDFNNLFKTSNLGWFMGLSFMLLFLFKNFKETKELQKKSENMSFRTDPEELEKRKRALGLPPKEEINLQEELTKAHSRFNNSLLRKKEQREAVQNAFNMNAGLKEYQNSQTNPFNKVSKKPQESLFSSSKIQENALQKKAANLATKRGKKKEINKKEKQIKLNNMKFLENMRTIYEKNGRVDLATSIQEQMKQKR